MTDSGSLVTDAPWPEGRNLNPYDAVADFIKYDAERSSHLDGPEHEISYCNEHVLKTDIDYDGLACVGLRLNSSKEWSSFSQLSAYVKKGIVVERLIDGGTGATNLFPEIAYALLTDPTIGAGELIGELSVDKERMETAAQFCRANGFFWDGVITESQNLREFIFQQASFCLLDFTILAGKFSLVPAVPYNKTDYTIDHLANPPIKALFTDGNIKDLKVTFLSPEERQIFQGRAMYRKETENGFPETKVIEKGLSIEAGGSLDDPIETFDLSNFCTTSDHAEKFLKYALRVRELVDHGIKFSTTPQAAMHLAPGEYFRLFSESTHTSRFENGSITSNGTVQTIGLDTLTNADIFYWRPGMEEVKTAKLTITNGLVDDATLNNSVFTVQKTKTSDRVYKVESLSYGEEGLIDSLKTRATDLKNVAFGQRVAKDRPIDAEIIPESKDVARGDEDFTVPGQQKDTVKVEAKEINPTLLQGNFENVLNNWQKYKNNDRFFYKTDTGAINFSEPLDLSDKVTKAITGIDKILQRASNRAPTLENLDNLKRAIDEAYTDIDLPDKQKSFVNNAVASVRGDIKDAILYADKSGKYAESMAEYEKAYKLRESLVKDLKLGKQKTALQSYNKIKKIFSQNPDYEFGIIQTTIDDLDKKREIRGGILGAEARSFLPSFNISPVTAIGKATGLGVAAATSLPIASVVAGSASPRIASSTAQLLGKSRRALDPITSRNVGLAQSGRLLQSGINPAQETDPDEYRGFVKNLLGIE